MSQRILNNGFRLSIWNRTHSKLHDLQQAGAVVRDSPKALASECDVICFCLTDSSAVEKVVFGESGVASGMRKGQVIVDFSSIGAEKTKRFAAMLHNDVGGIWIDAPVSGGVEGARDGTLIIFAGGDKASIEYVQPIFAVLAEKVTHLGASGAGQIAKSCNQMIAGCNIMLIAEMIATARKAGIDVDLLTDALSGGWADSRPLQIFGPRMAARITEPKLGALGTMLKDLDEATRLAHANGATVPITSLIAEQYRVCAQHLESGNSSDISSLISLYEGNV